MIASETSERAIEFVIPRWLDYDSAVASGELSIGGQLSMPGCNSFDRDLAMLASTPSIGLASDLLGKAFLGGRGEKDQLAKIVLKSNAAAKPTRMLAELVISPNAPHPAIVEVEVSSDKIRRLRAELRERPKNPTKWVDLARLYTASGQDEKAFESMQIALALAPQDRFTVRAFSRLCIHTNSCSEAAKHFHRNRDLLKDPWLLATAEALSKIDNKPSPLPRSVSLVSTLESQKFQRSELLEAFGMSEWVNGKERAAKRAFRAAWEVPSQNVIRHAEWFTRNNLPSLREETVAKFIESNEAASREAFKQGDIPEALRRCELWRFEEPYSVHPLAFESYLLCVCEEFDKVVKCFEKAERRRLLSQTLVLNYLFAALMLGNTELAEELLVMIEAKAKGLAEHVLLADRGLLALAQGDLGMATVLYKTAEERAGEIDLALKDRVFLHSCRSRQKFGHTLSEVDVKRVLDVKKNRLDAEFQFLIWYIEKSLPKGASVKD